VEEVWSKQREAEKGRGRPVHMAGLVCYFIPVSEMVKRGEGMSAAPA